MTTNKTPIQELYIEAKCTSKNIFPKTESQWLQKEKAFAFDCFHSGMMYGVDFVLSAEEDKRTTVPFFNKFWEKYVEQHTK